MSQLKYDVGMVKTCPVLAMDSVLVVYCGVQESCQGVFPPMEAWVFPAGNFEDLPGNITLNPRAVVIFWNWQEMIQLEHIIPAAERKFL